MSLKHLVRSLLVLLFLIGTCRVVQAQTCDSVSHTPSGTQVNGDTPISWVDSFSVDSNGNLSVGLPTGCYGGGTGWEALTAGGPTELTSWHVGRSTGHIAEPNIGSRLCEVDKTVQCPYPTCLCICGLGLYCSSCPVLVNDVLDEGTGGGFVRPVDDGTTFNTDDLRWAYPKAGTAPMSATLQNIGPIVSPPDISVTPGIEILCNGASSCEKAGFVSDIGVKICVDNQKRCFKNIIAVNISNQGGDSGTLVLMCKITRLVCSSPEPAQSLISFRSRKCWRIRARRFLLPRRQP
jgi:hypothetical protein